MDSSYPATPAWGSGGGGCCGRNRVGHKAECMATLFLVIYLLFLTFFFPVFIHCKEICTCQVLAGAYFFELGLYSEILAKTTFMSEKIKKREVFDFQV
jgi:hypothetical protein